MSAVGSKLNDKAAEMRRLFDASFACSRPPHLTAPERMLAISVGGEAFAVRVTETSGLAALEGEILPVPSDAPELLGLIGRRGAVVPVFSLAALLGCPSHDRDPKWLLFCRGETPIGLAFERLEHQFGADPAEIYALEASRKQSYVHETVRDGAKLRSVIGLVALAERIRARAH